MTEPEQTWWPQILAGFALGSCCCPCRYCYYKNATCDCAECEFRPDARFWFPYFEFWVGRFAEKTRARKAQNSRATYRPLWSQLASELGMGSTSASVLCRQLGWHHETGEALNMASDSDWREVRGMWRNHE